MIFSRNKSPSAARKAPADRRLKLWKRVAVFRQEGPVIRYLADLERSQGQAIEASRGAPLPPGWLLPHRQAFRDIFDKRGASAIRIYLLRCPEEMVPVAVWLLGRCASRSMLFDIFDFANDFNPAVRRHVAKALRRLEAWSRLDAMAKAHPYDAKVLWYARAPLTKRSFGERLKNFSEHVDASHAAEAAGPSRMALWLGDVDWIRRPPKAVEYIRRVLRRIHRWVHGFK